MITIHTEGKTMQMRGAALSLLLVVTVHGVGCNGSDPATDPDLLITDSGKDIGAGSDIGSDYAATDAARGIVTVQGTIGLYHQQVGLADVAVCKYVDGAKTSDCVQSDQNGRYTIELPADVDTGVTFEKTGYFSGFVPIHTAAGTIRPSFGTLCDREQSAECSALGVGYPDPAHGAAFVNAVEGASFALKPSPSGLGPFYADAQGHLVSTATEMTTSGVGAVFGLAPGVYELDVTHPTKTCTNAGQWPSTGRHTVRVPVLAGMWSGIVVSCK